MIENCETRENEERLALRKSVVKILLEVSSPMPPALNLPGPHLISFKRYFRAIFCGLRPESGSSYKS